jgi:hypothetical protein
MKEREIERALPLIRGDGDGGRPGPAATATTSCTTEKDADRSWSRRRKKRERPPPPSKLSGTLPYSPWSSDTGGQDELAQLAATADAVRIAWDLEKTGGGG